MLRERDVLVHHPYDSFATSTEEFIRQASEDPRVLTIKMTLYRTSGDSPIVRSLIRAAERGVQVAVLVEVKARFDEQANIAWAKQLERAGVHVVYGLVGLKTHSKCVLVVRDEDDGIRRYLHIGTGNYNSSTARLYEDIGLLELRPRPRRRPHPAVQPPDRLQPRGALPQDPGRARAGCATRSRTSSWARPPSGRSVASR